MSDTKTNKPEKEVVTNEQHVQELVEEYGPISKVEGELTREVTPDEARFIRFSGDSSIRVLLVERQRWEHMGSPDQLWVEISTGDHTEESDG